jgi:hypothetical protein
MRSVTKWAAIVVQSPLDQYSQPKTRPANPLRKRTRKISNDDGDTSLKAAGR